jgi:Thioredoxin domain
MVSDLYYRERKGHPSSESRKDGIMHLEIYITDQCANCQEAVVIAEVARSIAGLEVRVVNLDAPGQHVPPQVFATPTYVLDGLVVSLGNPERVAFLARLRAELEQRCEEKIR